MDLHGHTFLILGLGDSGLAMARWCARAGARLRVADSRAQPPRAAQLRGDVPQADLHTGGFAPGLLDGVTRVLKSPGLAPRDPALAPLLAQAREQGIPVQGELDLWCQAMAGLRDTHGYRPRVIAITGTNGKTTVTELTRLLVERAGRRVAMAGNVGPTLLQVLAQHLEPALARVAQEPQPGDVAQGEEQPPAEQARPTALPPTVQASPTEDADEADAVAQEEGEAAQGLEERPLPIRPPVIEPEISTLPRHMPEVWVLELSSFQLDGVEGFDPDAGVVLNLSQDHLDWHGTMAAYGQAKARVHGMRGSDCTIGRGVVVANLDDPAALAIARAAMPAPVRGRDLRLQVGFGLGAPQRPGDFGLVNAGGIAWLARAMASDEAVRRRRGEEEELHVQRLMPADALRIRGRHNAANALAALALATAVGCPLAPMLHGLREYGGEPHRIEWIASVGDVACYDDSKGTNVGATVAALRAVGQDHGPGPRVLAILGGDGKGQDFTPLCEPVGRHARFVALIGRDAPAIEATLQASALSAHVARQHCPDLPAAVRACAAEAQAGDALLLSPACASLDMFRDYAHRAEVFHGAIQAWAEQAGEVIG